MKREYKIGLGSGIVLLLLGIAAGIAREGAYNSISEILTLLGAIFIIGSVLRHLKFKEEPEKDERTRKLGAFALAYAWLVTMAFVGLLLWLDKYNLIEMTASQALGLTLSVTIIVAVALQWYFRRRGDIE